jgi:hypothetical protein
MKVYEWKHILIEDHILGHIHSPRGNIYDERLVPNLLRRRGRSIGRDHDVGEEGFEQTIVTLQLLHYDSVGY